MNRNTAIALAIGAFALLALFAMPLLAFAFGFGGMGMIDGPWGMPMHGTWDGAGTTPVWFALLGVISQLAFFALLAAGAYVLYRAVADDRTDHAIEELRAAYARGDIDDDEYERRREKLETDE